MFHKSKKTLYRALTVCSLSLTLLITQSNPVFAYSHYSARKQYKQSSVNSLNDSTQANSNSEKITQNTLDLSKSIFFDLGASTSLQNSSSQANTRSYYNSQVAVKLNSVFSSIIELENKDYRSARQIMKIMDRSNSLIDLQDIDPELQLATLLLNKNNKIFIEGMNELMNIVNEQKTVIEIGHNIKAEVKINKKIKDKVVASIANPTPENIQKAKRAMYNTIVNNTGIIEAKALVVKKNGEIVLTGGSFLA